MKNGWIKLHRALLDSAVFEDAELLKVMIYCVLQASYRDMAIPVGRQVIYLQPGQLLYGRRAVSQRLNIGENKLRAMMQQLEQLGLVRVDSYNKYSIVTLLQWEQYQNEIGKAEFPFDCDFFEEDEMEAEVVNQCDLCEVHQQEMQVETDLAPDFLEFITSKEPTENHKQEEQNYKIKEQEKNIREQENKRTALEKNIKESVTDNFVDEKPFDLAALCAERRYRLDDGEFITKGEWDDQPDPDVQEWIDAHRLFDYLWEQYPIKEGRHKVSEAQIWELYDVGKKAMLKAIRNYKNKKHRIPKQYWMYGSTFFNGGYREYLT